MEVRTADAQVDPHESKHTLEWSDGVVSLNISCWEGPVRTAVAFILLFASWHVWLATLGNKMLNLMGFWSAPGGVSDTILEYRGDL